MNRLLKLFLLMVAVMFSLWVTTVSYMVGNLRSFEKSTKLFIEEQHKLNDNMTRVMAKMAAAIEHNYEFNKTNKAFIQKVAEIYVPDEVALMRRIPARQQR